MDIVSALKIWVPNSNLIHKGPYVWRLNISLNHIYLLSAAGILKIGMYKEHRRLSGQHKCVWSYSLIFLHLSSLNAVSKCLFSLVHFWLAWMLRRDRTHPCSTDFQWRINFQEIHMRRHHNLNWQHWEGFCNQQSPDHFLKLSLLLQI